MFKTKLTSLVVLMVFLISFFSLSLGPGPEEATAGLPPSVSEAVYQSVAEAVYYLLSSQQGNGYLGSDWAAMGLTAAGEVILGPAWSRDGQNHLDYLQEQVAGWDLTLPAEGLPVSPPFPATAEIARVLLTVAGATYGHYGTTYDFANFGGRSLVELLKSRQENENGHFGNQQYQSWGWPTDESTYVSPHVWSILALEAAGESVPQAVYATDWLLAAQNGDGGWGYDVSSTSSDPDMTATALRALKVLAGDTLVAQVYGDDVNQAVDAGLAYLKTFQKEDGGFASLAYDENFSPIGPDTKGNAATTAEVVQALITLGHNPVEWSTGPQGQNNPVNFLLCLQQEDGSFALDLYGGQHWNRPELAGKVLLALAALASTYPEADPGTWVDPQGAPPPGGDGPGPGAITITVEVRGPSGVLYEEQVGLAPGGQTALEALRATGAEVELGYGGSYVVAVDGISAAGAAGWKYAVNGVVPAVSAGDYRLRDGDRVVWFYASDYLDTGGFAEEQSLAPIPPKQQQARQEIAARAVEALSQVQEEVGQRVEILDQPVQWLRESLMAVVGRDNPMGPEEKAGLREALAANRVQVQQEVKASAGGTLKDTGEEVALQVPAGSLKADTTLTVREEKARDIPLYLPLNYRLASPVYTFGPDGLVFDAPAVMKLRFVPDREDTDPGHLVLAWLDEEKEQWLPVPAVLDLANGYLVAEVRHFTRFAVLARQWEPVSFTDVTGEEYPWAREAVEMLAGRGILQGVGEKTFAPARAVTRAEAAKMLLLAMGADKGDSGKVSSPPFADISPAAWYASYVSRVQEMGLFRGDERGFFSPERPVSRQEMACVLARAVAKNEEAAGPETQELLAVFADREAIAPWAEAGVAAAARSGLLEGLPGGSLRPREAVTRAQAAVFIYRLLLHQARPE
ncbi:MAG: DUF4430 domain-containing protein [Clostridia bacterium]|nr:MAG: DUF4430 domain-containing protein [Clostridia bacterium]